MPRKSGAATPVALQEGIFTADTYKDGKIDTPLFPQVRFILKDPDHRKAIKTRSIPARGLMDFMLALCASTKERSRRLFPNDVLSCIAPAGSDAGQTTPYDPLVLHALTRDIFADAIGNLISIWVWMWG